MNSIFKKIAFRITIMFLTILVVAATGAVMHFDYVYRQDTQRVLTREAQMIDRIIQSSNNFVSLTDYIVASGDVRFTIIDTNGSIITNTEGYAVDKLDFLVKPEIVDAIDTGEGFAIRYVESRQETRMYVAISSTRDYIIRTSIHLRGIEFFATSVLLPFFIIIIFAILTCFVVALFVSRSITKPIIKLTTDAMNISDGKYEEITIHSTGDELQSLSYAINNMASKLNSNIKDLAEKNSQLNAVLQAIPGGVLAVDIEEFVLTANPAAIELFKFKQHGSDIKTLDMKQYSKLRSIVKKAMYASGVINEEMTITVGSKETVLQVFAVPAHYEGVLHGVIVLAQDITQMRRLENLQTVFIANVSHELRTPLTAISGFIETLKVENVPQEDAFRFLDIISLETERLSMLIDDILALSKLEQLSHETVHNSFIREEIKQSVKLFKVSAQKKNVKIELSFPDEMLRVKTKKDHINQLIINLVGNAIKYTEQNGEIKVSLFRSGNYAVITVEDNGIGIPEDEIPKLFERFYRVDKSRSRALGGTGLGLSIVKQIVTLLDGRIEVHSTLGKGTKFSVFLPLVD